MTVYCLTYRHNEHGTCVDWHTSKRKAEKAYAECKREGEAEGYDVSNPLITKLDITPTRQGIVRFLNNHTPCRDNG